MGKIHQDWTRACWDYGEDLQEWGAKATEASSQSNLSQQPRPTTAAPHLNKPPQGHQGGKTTGALTNFGTAVPKPPLM